MRVGWKSILLILAVMLVVVYVGVMSVMPRDREAHERRCSQIECYFEDSTVHRYITARQVEKYLHAAGLNPIGKTVSEINLQAIEDTLVAHPILASADCYMTIEGHMHIHLTQRTPIVHVMTAAENYFVATDRGLIPAWSTIRDTVLEVRGMLSHEQSCGEVADFAEWLAQDSVWRDRVDYLWLPEPHRYTLLLVGDTTQVLLGDLSEYPKQLRRLQRFLMRSDQQVRDQAYRQLDLRFDDQVIGRH
jgi:cell division protein FtsQ